MGLTTDPSGNVPENAQRGRRKVPNFEAGRLPYTGSGDRAERRRLSAILAEVLNGTPDLPAGMTTLAHPVTCNSCYRMRAVVSVPNYFNGEDQPLCMEHAESAFRHGQHECRDCARAFYGPTNNIPSWAVRGEVTGNAANSAYIICYTCACNYAQCSECANRYDVTRQQQCCAVIPRCNMCNRRESETYPLTRDVALMSRYSYVQTETLSGVCTPCLDEQIITCVCCARRARQTESYNHNNSGSYVCLGCVSGYTNNGVEWNTCGRHAIAFRPGIDELECCDPYATIHPYSYKPTPAFKGDGPMFYGAEVEICANDITRSAAVAGRGFKGLVYLKDDGSVSSGFEMVTHPMSFGYWATEFPWETFNALRDSGAYEHRSCGIHVHASRSGFSGAAHQHRWLAFFDRNQAQIEKIARRSGSSYARFGQLTPADKKSVARRKDHESPAYHQRYSAVNVNNRHTYEVRIFATSIDPNVVFSAVSFVAATVEYTRQLRGRDVMKLGGMTWSGFRSFVESRPEYATLLSEMNRVNA